MVSDHDVVEDGKRQRKARTLEGARDAGSVHQLRRQVGDVFAVEPDAPAVARVDAGDHVEKGGLAGSIRADETEDLVTLDSEIEGIHRHQSAEPLA